MVSLNRLSTLPAVVLSILLNLTGCAGERPGGQTSRMFPDETIPLNALRGMDGEILVQATSLSLGELTFLDVTVVSGGVLEVHAGAASFAHGRLHFSLRVDGPLASPEIALELHGEAIELGAIPALADLLEGGASRLELQLKGRGDNIRDVLATANGKLTLVVGKGRLLGSSLASVRAGILPPLFASVNPLSDPKPSELECAVLRFDIQNGIANSDNGIGLQTQNVTVVGLGTVDLRTEQLDLGLLPKTRGGVDVLGGMVRITGTLQAPRPKIDAQLMLSEGAAWSAGLATAGLSSVARFLGRRDAGTAGACATAADDTRGQSAADQREAQPTTEPGLSVE